VADSPLPHAILYREDEARFIGVGCIKGQTKPSRVSASSQNQAAIKSGRGGQPRRRIGSSGCVRTGD